MNFYHIISIPYHKPQTRSEARTPSPISQPPLPSFEPSLLPFPHQLPGTRHQLQISITKPNTTQRNPSPNNVTHVPDTQDIPSRPPHHREAEASNVPSPAIPTHHQIPLRSRRAAHRVGRRSCCSPLCYVCLLCVRAAIYLSIYLSITRASAAWYAYGTGAVLVRASVHVSEVS